LRGELEELRRRLGELEERLDFTERLVARHRDAERLPDR
jgi:tetrahydromethanopterin S-methyltransferase subunit G